jgi:hypothetical protein
MGDEFLKLLAMRRNLGARAFFWSHLPSALSLSRRSDSEA